MEPLEIDLEVGETLILGDYRLTLLDIDGQEVAVQIESPDDFSFEQDALNDDRPGSRFFSST